MSVSKSLLRQFDGWRLMTLASSMKFSLFAACIVSTVFLAGCGSSSTELPLAEVEGTVTLDGNPLSGALIRFVPVVEAGTSAPRVEESQAVTDAQGAFTLRGVHGGIGAMPGKHRVTISKQVLPNGEPVDHNSDIPPPLDSLKEVVPKKYSDPEATTLTADVPAEGGTILFELQSE